MKARILLVAVLALFSVSGFAGGGYGHNYRLLDAAKTLDHAAQYYAKQVDYYAQSHKFNKAARKFARSTAYFCDLVARGADIYDLHYAYQKAQSRYDKLRIWASSYQRASYGYSKVPDIYKVKYAFEDVGRIVSRKYNRHADYKDHDRYYGDEHGHNKGRYGKRGYGKAGQRRGLRGRISNRRSDFAFNFGY